MWIVNTYLALMALTTGATLWFITRGILADMALLESTVHHPERRRKAA